jgi:beta-phosphoglucomutase
MNFIADIPAIGRISEGSGLVPLDVCSDGEFRVGRDGVMSITATGDRKVEFIAFADRTLAYVNSGLGYPAYYPVRPVERNGPIKAILMDLDGTTVRSEEFWVSIIQMTVASILGNNRFELAEDDLPQVSGHSVSEHLQYCIDKYCPDRSVEEARRYYMEHTGRELKAIVDGKGRGAAFSPSPGLKEFLLEIKSRGIQIGLVTSGLYEKAWLEILSAFRSMGMGDPREFYDAIITAGYAIRKGEAGTLGELASKPHPWLYAEACRVGLGLGFHERHQVVGIEDSGAGVCAIRLAGFNAIGLTSGNIAGSGTQALCHHCCGTLEAALRVIG